MIRMAAGLFALLLGATPVFGQTPLETTRALLNAGDTAGLEHEMARLDQLVHDGGSAESLRQIAGRLFATTHPDWIETIEAWYRDYPNSPFAAAARTWVALGQVEQWRAGRSSLGRPTNKERKRRFNDALNDAFTFADKAVSGAQVFVPAYDAWLRTRELKSDPDFEQSPVLISLIDTAPDRASVVRIVAAIRERSHNPARDVVGACMFFAEKAQDYDADRCLVEAAILTHLSQDLRVVAKDMLPGIDDPALDAARLKVLLWDTPPTKEDGDQLIKLHMSGLKPGTHLKNYMTDAKRISRFAERRDYYNTAATRVARFIDDRLVDDPLNYPLLETKAMLLFERYAASKDIADLNNARQAWERALYYGGNSDPLWYVGTQLAAADRAPWDFEATLVFWENAIAYSGQSPLYILEHLYRLGLARDAARNPADQPDFASGLSPEETLERIKCPILHAAKAASALCRTSASPLPDCRPGHPVGSVLASVMKEGKEGMCPAVWALPISDLGYEPTSVEGADLPWK